MGRKLRRLQGRGRCGLLGPWNLVRKTFKLQKLQAFYRSPDSKVWNLPCQACSPCFLQKCPTWMSHFARKSFRLGVRFFGGLSGIAGQAQVPGMENWTLMASGCYSGRSIWMSGTVGVLTNLAERQVCCCFLPPAFAVAILFLLWKQHLLKVLPCQNLANLINIHSGGSCGTNFFADRGRFWARLAVMLESGEVLGAFSGGKIQVHSGTVY